MNEPQTALTRNWAVYWLNNPDNYRDYFWYQVLWWQRNDLDLKSDIS